MDAQHKKCMAPFDYQGIARSAEELYDLLKGNSNDRYQSWEHCYLAFDEAFVDDRRSADDVDKLCLHLAFYLASWGMYRGSSFLLRCDYRVHKKVVELLLRRRQLHGISCKQLLQGGNLKCLSDLYDEICDVYRPICEGVQRRQDKWNEKYGGRKENRREFKGATPTLVTKILMGALGCVPAFDRYVVGQLGIYGLKQSMRRPMRLGGYLDVVSQLAMIYVDNESMFEHARKTMKMGKIIYPQMKLLDMGLLGLAMKHD